jgi:flagellin FlaB
MKMKKFSRIFKKKDAGSMGIGAMIIFIAMVLVAGIAASVLVQVANQLQMQALYTGMETIDEVATGIAVLDVEGHYDNASDQMDAIAIGVRGRAGSGDIDLSQVVIELANNETKSTLRYNAAEHAFNQSTVFGSGVYDLTASQFGILVLTDADGSCSNDATTPIINKGDYVMLTVNTSAVFSGLAERADVWGNVIPEIGSWGIIAFRTPATYVDVVYDLQ